MTKRRFKRRKFAFLSMLFLVVPVWAVAGIPVVNQVMVTDVTTVSFSVIWAANEPCTAGLEIYEDDTGAIPVAGAVLTPHPVVSGNDDIREAAQESGVMKVRVTGLEADTTYFFRTLTTSKSTADLTYHPLSAPLLEVTTAVKVVRSVISGGNEISFSNDVIIEPCYLEDGTTPAEGSLLVATMEGAAHPLTAFVGDGVDLPNALIDLNNAFSRETGESLDLDQGENLTLLNFRGVNGYSIVTHDVPRDDSLCEVKAGELALSSGWNMVSFFLEPNTSDIEDILRPVWDNFKSLWTFDDSGEWVSYTKGLPVFMNDLNEIHSHKGYWLVLDSGYDDSDARLKVHGRFNTSAVQLNTGWNLVGSKSISTEPIPSMIGPYDNILQVAWTYEEDGWKSYTPGLPPFMNDIAVVKPGQGYMIQMADSYEW